jgi:hypothetical protein
MKTRILMATGLLVGCLSLLRCNVAKKDQRALERVQAKRPLVDAMLPVVQSLYPCVIDTIAVVIPGGIDSVFYPVPIIDTVYDRGSGYAQGFIDGQISISKKKYVRDLPDTVLKTVIDRTGITTYQTQLSYMKGQLSERNDRLKELQGARRERDWTVYGLIALLVITNVGWAVIRFK